MKLFQPQSWHVQPLTFPIRNESPVTTTSIKWPVPPFLPFLDRNSCMTPLNHKQKLSRHFKANWRYKKDMHPPIYATTSFRFTTTGQQPVATASLATSSHLPALQYQLPIATASLSKEATAISTFVTIYATATIHWRNNQLIILLWIIETTTCATSNQYNKNKYQHFNLTNTSENKSSNQQQFLPAAILNADQLKSKTSSNNSVSIFLKYQLF